jgi:hypothetical protein
MEPRYYLLPTLFVGLHHRPHHNTVVAVTEESKGGRAFEWGLWLEVLTVVGYVSLTT